MWEVLSALYIHSSPLSSWHFGEFFSCKNQNEKIEKIRFCTKEKGERGGGKEKRERRDSRVPLQFCLDVSCFNLRLSKREFKNLEKGYNSKLTGTISYLSK